MAYIKKYVSKADKVFRKLDNYNNLLKSNKCHYCGLIFNNSFRPTIDHVVPLDALHRIHSNKNTVLACDHCNKIKSNQISYSPNEETLHRSKSLNDLEKKIKMAEYRLDLNTNLSFNKWLSYHEKRGRWKVKFEIGSRC